MFGRMASWIWDRGNWNETRTGMGMGLTSLMEEGLMFMTVPRRVSTNWDMCRSPSLISTASSCITVL